MLRRGHETSQGLVTSMISYKVCLAQLLVAVTLASESLLPRGAAKIRRPGTHWCVTIRAASPTLVSNAHFIRLLSEVAAGWNGGDAEQAAACFTEDAVYS